MNINLHIERLILDGVSIPHQQRPRLQAAVETELARLLAEGGLSPALLAGGAVPYMSGESLQLGGGNDPYALGRQIARALHGGLKR